MARDHPRWGYSRIRGALPNLGHEIAHHYHLERNHQGLGNERIEKPSDDIDVNGAVECRQAVECR
jgi:hypothetical protein